MICISLLQQEQVCINSELHLWENNSPCAWSWSNGGIIEDINYYIHPTAYDRWSAQEKVCFHRSCYINQPINSTHLCRWAGSLTAAALLSSRWAQRLRVTTEFSVSDVLSASSIISRFVLQLKHFTLHSTIIQTVHLSPTFSAAYITASAVFLFTASVIWAKCRIYVKLWRRQHSNILFSFFSELIKYGWLAQLVSVWC